MKALLPLLVLSSFISCGGKDNGSNVRQQIETARDKVIAGTRLGMTATEVETGRQNIVKYDGNTSRYSIVQEDVKNTKKTTIIKVEGTLAYSLEEETRDNQTERRVSLEDLADVGDLDAAIQNGSVRLTNDQMIMNMTQDISYSTDNVSFSSSINMTGTFDLNFPCSSSIEQRDLSVKGTINGQEVNLPKFTRKTVSTCGPILSKNEIKAINLKSVTFCDTRAEDYNCESNKDMSYLTKDL